MTQPETLTATGLISGGLDSTVVAAFMSANYATNHYVFCDYGQKTLIRERRAFEELCEFFEPTSAQVVDMRWMQRIGQSALFETETTLTDANRKREYVPFRNANLLGVAVAMAETIEADAVLIGSTGGDTTCPDNSPAFLQAFQQVVNEGTMTDQHIAVVAPLIDLDKKGVIQLGLALDAPFERSWSCHNNSNDMACGGCSNCASRREAFTELGLVDPLAYEDTHQ